jgi:ERCC4-type nuclease
MRDMATLIVDVRERALAAALTAQGTLYSTKALEVGDFLIQAVDGRPLLVVERKSHADFAASNRDGRYREQRARLMTVRGNGSAILYMLEGAWSAALDRTYGSTTEKTLQRLTTRLLLRYGIPVLASASIAETARWCATLLAQLTEDPAVFEPEDSLTAATASAIADYTATFSAVKKGNKDAGSTAAAMLSTVPGLGAKKVEALLATHSLASLAALSVTDLAALSVGDRALGSKAAAVLHEALHHKI